MLTAIDPAKKAPTQTETFREADEERLLRWLGKHNGKWNLYFMVNRASADLRSKAKKEDVEAMEFLHVDVDPRKGEDVEAERRRIFEAVSSFKPEPSGIIDSGGGFQAFWRLDEPVHVGGDRARAEGDLEPYNIQLQILFGGDNCFNIDRIMRLPGTVNVPDEKKRRAGRVERLAVAVSMTDLEYSLADFTAAPAAQTSASGVSSSAPRVVISGNLPPVDINELPETVSPKLRMLIVQGDDPDDPTKYGSRSEVVWAVICGLVRARVADDVIASIVLDKDYAVSGHVLSQRRPAEYAARQIQRAKEEVEEPWLRVMNERHAVIGDIGGKCRVISEVMDESLDPPRTRISKQSFEDIRNRYMNERVQVGTNEKGEPVWSQVGKWWLLHPMRRQYDTIVFAPGREIAGTYNLWKGFACEAIPGENHLPLLQHIRDNICGGVEEHFHYVVRWMARLVQQPGTQGEVAIVLRGGQGTGKGTFVHALGSLFGRHYIPVTHAKHLVGQFNAHLRDCVLLFADEAFYAGDKQHESVLKSIVTEPTIISESKGVDAEVSPNFVHLVMSSNSHWVVPAGSDERRYFVLDVGDDAKQDKSYFAAIRRAMRSGGRESLLHYLLTFDLGDWEVRTAPKTEALRDQKMYSLSVEEQWWLERLMDGRTVASNEEWMPAVTKERLQADYLRYADAQRVMRRSSPTALGKFLSRVMPGEFPRSVQRMAEVRKMDGQGREYVTRERVYFYELPSLEECRAEWERRYGGSWAWPKDEEAPPMASAGADEPY